MAANEVYRLLPVRLDQPIEEQIFALQRADNRALQGAPKRPRQTNQHRVGQIDDVWTGFVGEPVEQLVKLLAQDAPLAFEHRDRHLAEQLGIG